MFQGKRTSSIADFKIDDVSSSIKEPKFKMSFVDNEIAKKEYRILSDFQDHIENLNEDFRNTFLNDNS